MKKEDVFINDFHEGIQVSQSELDRWRQDAINRITDDVQTYAYTRSGNGLVVAIRQGDEINVFEVSNGYKYYSVNLSALTAPADQGGDKTEQG